MRKFFWLFLLVPFLAPLSAHATNAQAQEYDDLGMALYRQGLYAKAIPYFQNAVQADPTDWQGYENLGNAYFKINANTDALAAYQKSLQINPDNSTLENIVQSLGNSATPIAGNPALNQSAVAPQPPPTGATQPGSTSVENEQPIQSNQPAPPGQPQAQGLTQPQAPVQPQTAYGQQPDETVVVRRHRRYVQMNEPTYADGLNPIDHAKYWSKFDFGYTWANVPDLINGANAINSGSYVNGDTNLPASYSGSALASNNGAHVGGEIGILLSPEWGISFGVKYAQLNDYTANVAYNDTYGDYENATLSPYVLPLTLNMYYFMPDSGGRFYIKGGIGYYFSTVHVNETYSYSNFYNQQESNSTENWVGDLNSSAIGFQLGIGREFAISRHFGLEVYVEGHYAKLTNYQGTLYDQNGNSFNAGLAMGNSNGTIDFDSPAYINAANGEHYATIDYMGFDAGISLNWYSF